jgi:hypothetical protein
LSEPPQLESQETKTPGSETVADSEKPSTVEKEVVPVVQAQTAEPTPETQESKKNKKRKKHRQA